MSCYICSIEPWVFTTLETSISQMPNNVLQVDLYVLIYAYTFSWCYLITIYILIFLNHVLSLWYQTTYQLYYGPFKVSVHLLLITKVEISYSLIIDYSQVSTSPHHFFLSNKYILKNFKFHLLLSSYHVQYFPSYRIFHAF